MPDKKVKMKVDLEKCKGCMLCLNACPKNILEVSKEVNKKGMQYVVLKDPEKCTGCGLCFIMCPDCAIEINKE